MVMPDHVHAVFQLGNKQTLSKLIQSFRRFTANQINGHLMRTGPLWQANYYDHGIRRDESLNKIIRYCYENPVRKGLVRQPEDYPYWRCKFDMQ
jgi:REP element-mobilizing transposase RayT